MERTSEVCVFLPIYTLFSPFCRGRCAGQLLATPLPNGSCCQFIALACWPKLRILKFECALLAYPHEAA
eukprot:4020121-Amphidinium_carterae.2